MAAAVLRPSKFVRFRAVPSHHSRWILLRATDSTRPLPNPIYHAMSNYATSFGFLSHGCGWHCDRRVLAIVAAPLVFVSGCGSDQSALLAQASVEIISGKDSAGATIELEKRGDDLTAARVIDRVLGTGEGEIISTAEGGVEFTIEFPAGATITYTGNMLDAGPDEFLQIDGLWLQRAKGIFGTDVGTWSVSSSSD